MKRDALFCDGTSSYVMPAEPKAGEAVTLRFRTAENDVADVILLVGEEKARYTMQKADSIENFDFWEIQWTLDEDPLVYCFEIQRGGEICYYNRCGVSDRIVDYYDFKIVPGFSTPDWAKGAVMYQIFVDRFYNGDPQNDVEDREYIYIGAPCEHVKDWGLSLIHI